MTEDMAEAAAERLRELLGRDLDAGFAELVCLYQNVIYATVLRACQHPVDAEDLAAEVFLRAYRALRSYDQARIAELQLRPWLVTIALNTWRNTVRDRGRRPAQVPLSQFVERPAQLDVFEAVTDRIDQQRELSRLTAHLPEHQRIAVVLRHVCELSVAEVAQVLGCPEGTAKSHVSRGLSNLRQGLDERRPQRRDAPSASTAQALDGRRQAGGGGS
jgi:RNA polymerase sigma factor (sigma-70 family)